MNVSDLLGAVVQSGMSPSSNDRMKNSLGGGAGIGDLLSSVLGGGGQQNAPATGNGGGIADVLSSALGGSSGGGIGDMLSNLLGSAGKAVGGNNNLAVGGLGALVGSLLGGGGKSLGGAVGGGLMALLGAMALKAIKGSGRQTQQVPVGLMEPQTDDEKKELEQNSELILMAMINATKADGQIDQNEINRITGKVKEFGVDDESYRYLMNKLQQPTETEKLIAAAKAQPALAAQVYAASLLAIEVDTQEEKNYLSQLAAGLGLTPQITDRIHEMVGLQPA